MRRKLERAKQWLFNSVWALRTLFKAASFESVIFFLFIFFQGIIPATSLYAIQSIIDWINSTSSFPIVFVSLWAAMLFADISLTPIISVVRLHLNEKVLAYCNLLLMEKANSFESLVPFENAKIYDELQFLKNESAKRPLNFVYVITGFFKDLFTLISILFLLSHFAWWIPLGLVFVSLPHAISTLWFEKQSWDQMLFRSPESRKMAWISSLILNDKIAKEVRLFGFGDYLISKYKNLIKHTYENISKNHWGKSLRFILISGFTVLGNLAIISLILLEAKKGSFGIGGFVIAIQALVLTQSHLISCISNLGMSTPCVLFFDKLRSFLKKDYCAVAGQKKKTFPCFFQEIRFEAVSFSYPDGRQALSNVSFSIKKGEKLAIVGQNGTGKTTIVKLLLRFYDPSEGRILIDGINLKELDIAVWRSLISAVFQDFGQYHFTVFENVALGNTCASENRIAMAMHKGGFTPTLERLPNGIHTQLGKEFDGTALSGGEWQKLAMSRAFLRDSDILILDEPTASLDPQSEQEVFKRFADYSDGKTTILITHRLGSVKMADRILVFKQGQLIENGTHQQLFQTKGEYFSLYTMQAKQYQH